MNGAKVSRTWSTTSGSTERVSLPGGTTEGGGAVTCISIGKTLPSGTPSYLSRLIASSAIPFDANSPTTNLSMVSPRTRSAPDDSTAHPASGCAGDRYRPSGQVSERGQPPDLIGR